MLTGDEVKFLYECSDTELMESIVKKCTLIPSIMVTIEGGAFQYAHANTEIRLIIEDLDNMEEDKELNLPIVIECTEKEFADVFNKASLNEILRHAFFERDKPFKEVQIIVHDKNDLFPFSFSIDGDLIAVFKTFEEAAEFMSKYIEIRQK